MDTLSIGQVLRLFLAGIFSGAGGLALLIGWASGRCGAEDPAPGFATTVGAILLFIAIIITFRALALG